MRPDEPIEDSHSLEHEVVKWRKSLLAAFQFAAAGAVRSLRLQRNLQIHFVAACIVLLWDLCMRPTAMLVTVSILTIAFVMSIELVNTALEHLTDLATSGGYHDLAKWTKDAAAGAVLVSSLGAVAVGAWLLFDTWPWRFQLFSWHQWFGALESLLALLMLCVFGLASWFRRR